MLPGPCNVFFDNSFVCKATIPLVFPEEKFQLPLGVDPTVKVEYKPLQQLESKSGVISKVRSVTYKHFTTITNTKASPISIKLSDQIPYSSTSKISVKRLEPSSLSVCFLSSSFPSFPPLLTVIYLCDCG